VPGREVSCLVSRKKRRGTDYRCRCRFQAVHKAAIESTSLRRVLKMCIELRRPTSRRDPSMIAGGGALALRTRLYTEGSLSQGPHGFRSLGALSCHVRQNQAPRGSEQSLCRQSQCVLTWADHLRSIVETKISRRSKWGSVAWVAELWWKFQVSKAPRFGSNIKGLGFRVRFSGFMVHG
jgi:hypothetical protein